MNFCSLGDGLEYPVHSRHQQSTYHSMDNTQNRSDDNTIAIATS